MEIDQVGVTAWIDVNGNFQLARSEAEHARRPAQVARHVVIAPCPYMGANHKPMPIEALGNIERCICRWMPCCGDCKPE